MLSNMLAESSSLASNRASSEVINIEAEQKASLFAAAKDVAVKKKDEIFARKSLPGSGIYKRFA